MSGIKQTRYTLKIQHMCAPEVSISWLASEGEGEVVFPVHVYWQNRLPIFSAEDTSMKSVVHVCIRCVWFLHAKSTKEKQWIAYGGGGGIGYAETGREGGTIFIKSWTYPAIDHWQASSVPSGELPVAFPGHYHCSTVWNIDLTLIRHIIQISRTPLCWH